MRRSISTSPCWKRWTSESSERLQTFQAYELISIREVGVSSQAKRELRAGYLPKENMDKPVAGGADGGLHEGLQFELKPQRS